MDKFPKFIIEGNSLIIAKATYHRQICHDIDAVSGGGWWIMNPEKKELHLYGKSDDFGRATPEDILMCMEKGTVGTRYGTNNLSDYTIYYSVEAYLPKKRLIKHDEKYIERAVLIDVLEQLIYKNKRPIGDNNMYFDGKVDAYNDVWKLVEGIDDDYTDGIDTKGLIKSD